MCIPYLLELLNTWIGSAHAKATVSKTASPIVAVPTVSTLETGSTRWDIVVWSTNIGCVTLRKSYLMFSTTKSSYNIIILYTL